MLDRCLFAAMSVKPINLCAAVTVSVRNFKQKVIYFLFLDWFVLLTGAVI